MKTIILIYNIRAWLTSGIYNEHESSGERFHPELLPYSTKGFQVENKVTLTNEVLGSLYQQLK